MPLVLFGPENDSLDWSSSIVWLETTIDRIRDWHPWYCFDNDGDDGSGKLEHWIVRRRHPIDLG